MLTLTPGPAQHAAGSLCPTTASVAAQHRFGSPVVYLIRGLEALVSVRKTAQTSNISSPPHWVLKCMFEAQPSANGRERIQVI